MNRLYLQTSRRLAAATSGSPRFSLRAPPASAVAAMSQCHQQRWMASKKNKNKGGKGGGGGGSGGGKGGKNTIKIQPVWGSLDLEENSYGDDELDAEMAMTVTAKRDAGDIARKLEEEFGMEGDNLEFLDDKGGWKPLSAQELKTFKGKLVKVRDKDGFDEDDGDDEDEEYDYDEDEDDEDEGYNYDEEFDQQYGSGDGPSLMRAKIMEVVEELKEAGYERQGESTLRNASGGETIPTKVWVLSKADTDKELLSLLLDNIGALDHIAQCLHFDAVWNNDMDQDTNAIEDAVFADKEEDAGEDDLPR